jgi:hypothetical protein
LRGRIWRYCRILLVCLLGLTPSSVFAVTSLDLADGMIGEGLATRLYGHRGNGAFGVPVAAGADCDGDGHSDLAFAAMTASPLDRSWAGEVYLFFGDGDLGESFDTAQLSPSLLRIFGDGSREATGSEVWIDDVTGDGIGDLLIARQNFSPTPALVGAGALTILVGGPELRAFAATLAPLDLRDPPPSLTLFTLTGAAALDRLGIWMRTGDASGDGVADILVGADQEDLVDGDDNGVVYLVRGGPHLAVNATVDLSSFGATILAGDLARILPPAAPVSDEFHLGATLALGDLDGNGRAELLVAAALNRVGATLPALDAPFGTAHGRGGSPRGTLYILWDENLPPTGQVWPDGLTFALDDPSLVISAIGGGTGNTSFGEEIVAGFDVNDDGKADLFAGDIVGNLLGESDRQGSGSGHLFYDAASLKGLSARRDLLPESVVITDFLGDERGSIAADTALVGDFDGDGVDDLAFSAPHQSTNGRVAAGVVFIFFGRDGVFPATIDLRALPDEALVRVARVEGARGRDGADSGDTLAYSAVAADVDGDGRSDLVINEMEGNGVAEGAIDVGNLLVIAGGYASGLVELAPCGDEPRLDCDSEDADLSLLDIRDRDDASQDRLSWRLRPAADLTPGELGDPRTDDESYRLCIFGEGDDQGPAVSVLMPGAALCSDRPCWSARGDSGWRYRDRTGARGGVRRFRIGQAGNGAFRMGVTARGEEVELPVLPVATPLVVQVVRGAGTVRQCWQARFESPAISTTDRFKARTP